MTVTIPRRSLGSLETSALGLGCMGISGASGPPSEESGTQAIRRAIELGITNDAHRIKMTAPTSDALCECFATARPHA